MSDHNNTGGGNAPPASLESAMAEVESMILNARRALAGGELLDMTPLGDRTMALASSDPDSIRLRLEKMVSDLNRLEDQIRAGAGLSPADGETGKD